MADGGRRNPVKCEAYTTESVAIRLAVVRNPPSALCHPFELRELYRPLNRRLERANRHRLNLHQRRVDPLMLAEREDDVAVE